MYGSLSILLPAYGLYNPKKWVEWVERQFVYRRERTIAGIFFLLVGLAPIYYLISVSGWKIYLLSVFSGSYAIIGALTLSYYEPLRQALLSFSEMDEKHLRIWFGIEIGSGVIMIILGVL